MKKTNIQSNKEVVQVTNIQEETKKAEVYKQELVVVDTGKVVTYVFDKPVTMAMIDKGEAEVAQVHINYKRETTTTTIQKEAKQETIVKTEDSIQTTEAIKTEVVETTQRKPAVFGNFLLFGGIGLGLLVLGGIGFRIVKKTILQKWIS